MMQNDLTVVLTLKGRPLHTLRWFWYADQVRLPYRVIVADGDVHPTVDRLLSDPSAFSSVARSYRRYHDASFTDYYRKCAEVARTVDTEYVMISDNDDFLVQAGIERSLRFLRSNPDFACAGGPLPDFSLIPGSESLGKVQGSIARLRFGYSYETKDIADPVPRARVLEELLRYQTIFYHVYRTDVLRTILDEMLQYDFSDLEVAELFGALRTASLGKVRSDPSSVNYIRQTGTSMLSTYYTNDWVHYLLRKNIPEDYRKLATAISAGVGAENPDAQAEFREQILDVYAERIRNMLAHSMLRHRFPRLFRLKQEVRRLAPLLRVKDRAAERSATRRFWKRLEDAGASRELLDGYRQEIAAIQQTLDSRSFAAFVSERTPDLLTE